MNNGRILKLRSDVHIYFKILFYPVRNVLLNKRKTLGPWVKELIKIIKKGDVEVKSKTLSVLLIIKKLPTFKTLVWNDINKDSGLLFHITSLTVLSNSFYQIRNS